MNNMKENPAPQVPAKATSGDDVEQPRQPYHGHTVSSPAHAGLPKGESPDEWYEREKAAFRVWWESEGERAFSETPTMAAGAGWFARAETDIGKDALLEEALLRVAELKAASEELVAEYRRGYQDGLDDRAKIAAGQ